MNNKTIGSNFENEFCNLLKTHGFWVHFMAPDRRGAQPFDVVAVKDGVAYAIDCKTLNSRAKSFPLSRLEDNQVTAFFRWMRCGNRGTWIAIKHDDNIFMLSYPYLAKYGNVALKDCIPIERWLA